MYVYVVVQFHPWFKILCPFVITIPQNKGE